VRVTPTKVVRYLTGRLGFVRVRRVQAVRARAQPVPEGPALFCFGASYMSGIEDGAQIWPEIVAEALGMPLVNRAVGGDTTKDTLRRARLVNGRPDARDLVLVECGMNDAMRWGRTGEGGLAGYQQRLLEIVRRLGARGATVRVLADAPLPDWKSMPRRHDQCSDEIYEDARKILLAIPDNIDIAPVWDPATMVLPDMVHPNQKGVEAIAGAVLAALKE
jgi:lysophospholipase L1-like esterase